MSKWLIALLAVAAATMLWLPLGPEATFSIRVAAALLFFTIGLWATGAVPEHVAAVGFLVACSVLSVSSAPVIFSGFASSAFWLVFGGLVIGAAAERTGLGRWLAGGIVHHVGTSYLRVITGIVVGCSALGFLVPTTMGRLMILIPIVNGLADNLGMDKSSRGRVGMLVATTLASFFVPSAILPANLPNVILLGAADSLYDIGISYGTFLLIHLPITGLLKGVILIALVYRTFNSPLTLPCEGVPANHLSKDGKWLLCLLSLAMLLWMTDWIHGVSPGWTAAAVALVCLLPQVNFVPPDVFRDKVSLSTLLYVAGVLGVSAVIADSRVGDLIATLAFNQLNLMPDQSWYNYAVLNGFGILVNILTTNPGMVAILTPMAEEAATLTGLPLFTILMIIVNSYTTILFPYQAPPIVVGVRASGIRIADAVRIMAMLAVLSILCVLPLNYLYWSFLGYI